MRIIETQNFSGDKLMLYSGSMGLYNHAMYMVATKAFIRKDTQYLVLITPDGYIDFPGGRVDESERSLPWVEALQREIQEEAGDALQVNIGRTMFVSKRQYHKHDRTNYIAAIFFECEYISGDITLSDEHGDHAWMTLDELLGTDKKFVSDDERQQLSAYFRQ